MSTEEEEEDDDQTNEERVEGDIDKVDDYDDDDDGVGWNVLPSLGEKKFWTFSLSKSWPCQPLCVKTFDIWAFCRWSIIGCQVLKLVHELKAKDIEEYRKKIVERDKNKEDEVKEDKIKEDEDKGIREHRRRIVVQRDTNKGEGSKFDKREKKDDKDGDAFQIDDTNDDRNHLEQSKQHEYREKSPAMVFTFDQEDIQTSKLLSFEKVFKVIKGVFNLFLVV